MSVISLLVIILLFGLVYWVITQIPIDPIFKRIALVVLVVFLVLILLQALGLLAGLPDLRLR